MKVVIAIDSLKGSLTSREAGDAVREGLLRAIPDARAVVKPVADGGEGTCDALVDAFGGQRVRLNVTGPYGDTVEAEYGWLPEKRMAVMEMAAAAGLTLSPRREPLEATTFGVGQMIGDALDRGCREFLIGIGGSATNDGGLGMLSALGFHFLDRSGACCGVTGGELGRIARVDLSGARKELAECRFRIACDVNNPLCGAQGCTYVFGPQKGVRPEQRERMDADMAGFAAVTAAALGVDFRETPGAGAAGGLGFAFLSYLRGELRPGIQLVLEAVELEKCLQDADLVVTGEGCLDRQTAFGKTPAGVAGYAKCWGVPVVALAGGIRPGADLCNRQGIDAYFAILPRVMSLEEAMEPETARRNMTQTAEQVFRLIQAVAIPRK